ncbi:uncharacterized protein LOC106159140 isoform X3 [Lingula anatina]|uniref:Uncharacterized protein LOC106159140 isoform X3 n=1 Tax=Lingula anatina TaxID=7574 RepID=A0A1S3I0C4_LINAN|nr:uncharacterized protein LOC106159140 isoform X3 [Lingula anatina]|eukprot:XP_013390799.1 uncharacterized protein LOC106159140 isoform X3 [Lingula anatina]
MPDEAVTPVVTNHTAEASQGEPTDWSHVLAEFTGMEELQAPIRASARIKYTSLSVSKQYIALGSTTGAVYIFQKSALKYLQLLSSETEGSVIKVEFSPDDEICAYATSKGYVVVMELNISKRGKPERLRLSVDHKNATITSLCWNDLGTRLFIGDNTGKVTAANISTSKAKDLIKLPSEVILRLDSAVVQMDFLDGKLLISTLTKSYLCNTVKQTFTQIGKKARDGRYGSCFFHGPKIPNPIIYCSRPGSRMWEVDGEGNVLNTHQFKQLLAIPSMPVISYRCTDEIPDISTDRQGTPLSTNLPVLLLSGEQFLLSWSEKGIYVFDPANVKVVLWTNQFQDIEALQCHNSDVYFLHGGSKVTKLSIMPVEKCVLKLFVKQQWKKCAQLCVRFANIIISAGSRRHVTEAMLSDLRDHLHALNMGELAMKVEDIIIKLEPDNHDKSGSSLSSRRSSGSSLESMKLESGIYVVNSKPKKKAENDRKSSRVATPTNNSPPSKIPSPNEKNDDTISVDLPDGKESQAISQYPNGSPANTNLETSKDVDITPSKSESDLAKPLSTKEATIIISEVTPAAELTTSHVQRSSSGSSLHSAHSADAVPLKRKLSSESLVSLEQKSHSSTSSRRGSLTSISSGDVIQSRPESVEIVVRSRKPNKLKKKRAHPEKVQESISDIQPGEANLQAESSLEMSSESGHLEFSGSFEASQEFDPAATVPASSSPKTTLLAMKERFSSNFSTKTKSIFKTFKDLKVKARLPKRGFQSSETDLLDIKDPSLQSYTEESAFVKADVEDEEDEEIKPKSEFPIVDTSILKEKTNSTRQKLRSSEILTHPQATQQVLSQWVRHLHSTLQLLHTAIHSLKKQKLLQQQQQENLTSKQAGDNQHDTLEQSGDDLSSSNENTLMETPQELVEKDEGSEIEIAQSLPTDKLLPKEIIQRTETSNSNDMQGISICRRLSYGGDRTSRKPTDVPGYGVHENKSVFDRKIENSHDNITVEKSDQEDEILVTSSHLGQSPDNDDDDDEGIVLTLSAIASEEMGTTTLNENAEVSDGNESDHYEVPYKYNQDGAKMSDEAKKAAQTQESSSLGSSTLSELSSESEHLTINSPEKFSNAVSSKLGIRSLDCEKNAVSHDNDRSHDLPPSGAILTDEAIKDTLSHLFDNPIYVRDPFNLEKDIHEQVAELAMLCFEARIHGGISLYIQPNLENDCDKTESISDLLLPKGAFLANGDVKQTENDSGMCQMNGELTKEYNSTASTCKSNSVVSPKHHRFAMSEGQLIGAEDAQEDVDIKELGIFLKCYFHLLDCERIKRALRHWRDSNRKMVWVALLEALKELGKFDLVAECLKERNVNGALDLLRSGVLHDKRPVLAHIVRLFQLSPTKTLDFCAEDQKYVSPIDVLYMCQDHSKYPQHLIHYVNRCLEDLPPRQRKAAIKSMCKDRDFYLSWIQCLLVTDGASKEHMQCSCGMPRPGAHLFKWTQDTVISEAQKHGGCDQEVHQIFKEQGYWLGYLQLCDKTRESTRREAIEIVLQLGDEQLLHHGHKLGCYPRTNRDWEYVFHLKELQNCPSGNTPDTMNAHGPLCVKCKDVLLLDSNTSATNAPTHLIGWSPTVTWENLARLLVRSVGGAKALDLLGTFKIPDGTLSVAFLQNTLCTTVLHQQQRLLVHNILETVDTYLWSQKPTHVAPQVLFAIEEEKICIASRSRGEEVHLNEALQAFLVLGRQFTDVSSRTDSKHWLEEPEGHWGVHTVITGVCAVCELPLKEQVSIAEPGLLVFDCGHSFHKKCLPEQACMLCLEDNLMSQESMK